MYTGNEETRQVSLAQELSDADRYNFSSSKVSLSGAHPTNLPPHDRHHRPIFVLKFNQCARGKCQLLVNSSPITSSYCFTLHSLSLLLSLLQMMRVPRIRKSIQASTPDIPLFTQTMEANPTRRRFLQLMVNICSLLAFLVAR